MLLRYVALSTLLIGFLDAHACTPQQEKCSIALTELTGRINDPMAIFGRPSQLAFLCNVLSGCTREDYACSPNQETGESVVQKLCIQPASNQCKNNLSANNDRIDFNFLVDTIEIPNLKSVFKCWCINERRSFVGIARTAVLKNCGPTELAGFNKVLELF
uniref:DUF19 domain-containing protein n=1 Tax=Caenorhabditis japonica TaxID=281687 RepID=A0A8R1HKY7_CAEJA